MTLRLQNWLQVRKSGNEDIDWQATKGMENSEPGNVLIVN